MSLPAAAKWLFETSTALPTSCCVCKHKHKTQRHLYILVEELAGSKTKGRTYRLPTVDGLCSSLVKGVQQPFLCWFILWLCMDCCLLQKQYHFFSNTQTALAAFPFATEERIALCAQNEECRAQRYLSSLAFGRGRGAGLLRSLRCATSGCSRTFFGVLRQKCIGVVGTPRVPFTAWNNAGACIDLECLDACLGDQLCLLSGR